MSFARVNCIFSLTLTVNFRGPESETQILGFQTSNQDQSEVEMGTTRRYDNVSRSAKRDFRASRSTDMRKHLLTFLDDCLEHPSQTALASRRGLRASRWSYGRLRTTAFQFARELEGLGIVKGDRVLFWANNSPEWVASFFGCLLRGVIVVPLDVESSIQFGLRVQSQVEAKLLLLNEEHKQGLQSSVPTLNIEDLSDVIAHHPADPYSTTVISEDDIAEIIFTSGTTAEPKGVCLTHRNLLSNISPIEREIEKYLKYERFFHPIRFLNLLPLSHVFGQFMGMFVPQLLAGEVHFQDSLTPSEIVESCKRYRISVLVSVPRVLDTLRSKIERDYELRSKGESFRRDLLAADTQSFLKRWWTFRRVHRQFGWKFWSLLSGGASLAPETEAFWRRLGYAVVQGYGMTEAAALITVNHPFSLSRRSIGKTLPGQELKLDEHGEILIRGENVSPGYWGGELRPITGEHGWLRTGDVGEMDEQGNLYFKGRKKDVIVTAAGLNIYPDDLEAALNSQEEVRDSAVVALETQQGPEAYALLLLRDDKTDVATVVKRANGLLNPYQQIRRWAIWPGNDFPRTPTQKIRKAAVIEKVKEWATGENQVTARAGDGKPITHSFISEAVARIGGESIARLDPAANLETDLKLDSLGRVELLGALEDHYQVDIDEAAFTGATTVGDIERMIREGSAEHAVKYSYPRWAHRFPIPWIRRAILSLVILPLTRWMSRATVKGTESLRNLSVPVLFIANHITMIDAALVLLAIPPRFQKRLAVAMEGEVLGAWRRPPSGTNLLRRLILFAKYILVVSLFNVFPLPQKSGFRKSFAYAGELMDRGYNVLIFPEGARTPDGEMKPFKEGIGFLAKQLNVPIIPIGIKGLFELKKEGKKFARKNQIEVSIGESVSFSRRDGPEEITRTLQAKTKELSAKG
jgi:long-chain acyl-CoA synthetase